MRTKRVLALLVLFGGVITSFIIFRAPEKNAGRAVAFETSSSGENHAGFMAGDRARTSTSSPSGESSSNFTKELAKQYVQEVVAQNPESITIKNGKPVIAPPNPAEVNKALLKGFTREIVFSQLEVRDVRKGKEEGLAAELAYLKQLSNAFEKNFGSFPYSTGDLMKLWVERENVSPITEYVRRIPDHVSDLLAIPVPPRFTEFHLENVNLWQKRLAIFEAMAEFAEDPVKALIAFKKLPDVIRESEDLESVLKNYFKNRSNTAAS